MRALAALLLAGLFLFPGCIAPTEEPMVLATTTSMRDSGLLDVLLPAFEDATGHKVDVVAVGTGAALELGRSGDADVLIVHAPEAEAAFLAEGHGTDRTVFAWNTFVLLAPEGMEGDLLTVLDSVVEEERCFVSRGDASGTHMREQAMWRTWAEARNTTLVEGEDGVRPDGEWYLSIGQGMGAAITVADEKRCLTLSDLGTALFRSAEVDLTMLTFEDDAMVNPYSIIPLKGPHLEPAMALQTFLLGDGSSLIAGHTVAGQPLFTPGQP